MPKYKKIPITRPIRIDWTPALFLSLTPLAALGLTVFFFATEAFHWGFLILFLSLYAATAMAITGGYHRLFAHRSYEASPLVKILYALFGAAAFQNSILKWATDHRIHHRFVDSNEDPYSIQKGFWYAHVGWMYLKEKPHPQIKAYQRDLLQDPIVVWQDKHYLVLSIGMCFLLPTLIGHFALGSWLGGLTFGGFVRLVAVHHGTFLINSLSHWWGRQTYTDENTAKDNLVAALLTFGEGYHNFHHLFANDYRNGVRWYHWDPTKWLIQLKSKLGLVYNLRQTPDHIVLNAKLQMDEKRLQSRLPHAYSENLRATLTEIRAKLLEAQQRIQSLKQECRQLKSAKADNYRLQLNELRQQLQLAKKEWLQAYNEWRRLLSQPLTTS